MQEPFIPQSNKVDQSSNTVFGPQAGRDVKYEGCTFNPDNVSNLKRLIDKYKAELETNQEFKLTIDALQHYLNEVNQGQPVGLSEKLNKGGRNDQIQNAKEMKELFNKQLHEHMFSKTAQEIFAYLLGEIHTRFECCVKPAILEGKSRSDIDLIVFDKVISPVVNEIGLEVIGIYWQHILGMLYFLTGNCHINWHKGDDDVNISSSS